MVPNPQLVCSLAGIKEEQADLMDGHTGWEDSVAIKFWKAQSHGIARAYCYQNYMCL